MLISENLRSEVSSLSSSVHTHPQEKQKKHLGNEIHTHIHLCHCVSCGYVEPVLPPVKAYLRELNNCQLDFLIPEVSFIRHLPFSKRPFRGQITDSSNAIINYEIPVFRAGILHLDDAHRLVNLPDALCHFIILLLCCVATLILPNPHGICCTMADSNTSILSKDANLQSCHLGCGSICNDRLRQPEGITFQFEFPTAVNG